MSEDHLNFATTYFDFASTIQFQNVDIQNKSYQGQKCTLHFRRKTEKILD